MRTLLSLLNQFHCLCLKWFSTLPQGLETTISKLCSPVVTRSKPRTSLFPTACAPLPDPCQGSPPLTNSFQPIPGRSPQSCIAHVTSCVILDITSTKTAPVTSCCINLHPATFWRHGSTIFMRSLWQNGKSTRIERHLFEINHLCTMSLLPLIQFIAQ